MIGECIWLLGDPHDLWFGTGGMESTMRFFQCGLSDLEFQTLSV